MQWYLDAVKKYAVFDGRARRKEFWMFALVYVGIYLALAILDIAAGLFDPETGYGLLTVLFALSMALPGLAVGARRLHDTGRSGWWQLLNVVPLGVIILIFMWAADGDSGENDYGSDPKATLQAEEGVPVRVGGNF